ncbi:MAG: phosphoribosylglycinamide formyltransferase [Thermoplasmata archaeon]|nr:phosphoribosylglycinamide formyltransferase [Thermoplasmata archaeon]
MTRLLALGVLVSGGGTTLEALAEQAAGRHVPVKIAMVLSDRPSAPALEKARQRGLATAVLPMRNAAPDVWAAQATRLLSNAGVELILLAGFLSILPPSFVKTWEGRAINLHPSLLPRHGGKGFYGDRVHAAVLAAGDSETGATVHLVNDAVDGGPILAQQRVPVQPGDTAEGLRLRVRDAERVALYSVLTRFAEGEWPLPYRESSGRRRSGRSGPESPSGPSA